MAARRYTVSVTTVGPVHIGDGGMYGKRDYFINKGHIAVLDVRKFTAQLSPDQLGIYLDYLGDPNSGNLDEFLASHSDLHSIARSCTAYETELRLSKNKRGEWRYCDVRTFIKDVYGLPYVPGSSVKGALRTALLVCLVKSDSNRYRPLYIDGRPESRRSRWAGGAIERKAFRSGSSAGSYDDAVDDALKYLSVSDSAPLSLDDLAFVKKYDQFSKADNASHKRANPLFGGKTGRGNELNIYRECLKPGVTFTCDLTIDDRIDDALGLDAPLDGTALSQAIRQAYDLYAECFLKYFETEDAGSNGSAADGRCQYIIPSGPLAGMRCRNQAVDDTGYCRNHQDAADKASSSASTTLYLGGGVDFDSKTVVNALFDDPAERVEEISKTLYEQFPSRGEWRRFPELHRDIQDAGFSPKDGRFYGRKHKDDHRHWRDQEFGVSPHTLKMGILGGKKLPMGKCDIEIREQQ